MDNIIEFTIPGNTPSKKNSKQWTGKCLISSSLYRKRHANAKAYWRLMDLYDLRNDLPLKGPLLVVAKFYRSTLRKYDVTNAIESVNDFLVDVGFLEDDNNTVIPAVIPIDMGKDKDNPRAEIKIYLNFYIKSLPYL